MSKQTKIDVERKELEVYTERNIFYEKVLEFCENKPKFVIDKAPWLKRDLKSFGLKFRVYQLSAKGIYLKLMPLS